MSAKRRIWSTEEKMEIIREVEKNGLTETLRKHNVAPPVFYRWRQIYSQKYDNQDVPYENQQRIDAQVKQLQKENERLKNIIIKQALEIEVKDEILRKFVH
jgi:transposase-like protein